MSIKKNIVGNGLASLLQKGIRVLEQLLLVPFFITSWGAAYYGEWLTLTIIPSIIGFSDLGFGSAAANLLVLKYAGGQKKEAADVAKSGFFIITCTIILALLISIIMMLILEYYNVFQKSLIDSNDAIWAVSILILSKLISFYTQFFEAYFRSARKASLSMNYISANALLNLLGGGLVLACNKGIIEFAVSQLFVAILFNIIYRSRAKSLINFEFVGKIYLRDIKSILKKGFGFLLSPMWQAIYFQGSTFVVRIVLGAEAVAVFNTVRTVCRSVNQIFNIISNAVFPELQFEIASGNIERARKLFRISIWITFISALLGVIFLSFFGKTLYNIWTKNQLNVPDDVWIILIGGILFNALWWTAGVIFRAVNKPFNFSVMGVIASLISVISSYFLSKQMGITGAAIGTLLLDVLLAFYVLPLSCHLLRMSVKEVVIYGPKDIMDVCLSFNKEKNTFF